MNYGKQRLKVLGLSLLTALGLMAFGASGASASGSFLIEGLFGEWEDVPIAGEGENLLEGRFWVLNLNIEISCHAASTLGKISSDGHGHATITFSNCLASGTNADGTLKGSVCKLSFNIVANVLALVILHDVVIDLPSGQVLQIPYVLFSPLDGLTFVSINGFPCIPSANVRGSVVANISNPSEDDIAKLISTKKMLTLFPNDKLTYGFNEAHLDADAHVILAGEHLADRWGAI